MKIQSKTKVNCLACRDTGKVYVFSWSTAGTTSIERPCGVCNPLGLPTTPSEETKAEVE